MDEVFDRVVDTSGRHVDIRDRRHEGCWTPWPEGRSRGRLQSQRERRIPTLAVSFEVLTID